MSAPADARRAWVTPLTAGALVAALTSLPLVLAALRPPPGSAFLGFFFQIEDIYNYLSYVQQAAAGALSFHNKLAAAPHPSLLVNVEWLVVGLASAALGQRHALAYHLVGVAALLALVLGTDRWLRRAGLPGSHRFAALLLVFLGGGLGGLRWKLGGGPPWNSLDLISGLYPFMEALLNPHFVWATALLVWTLLALMEGRTALALLLGCVLGLSRPYDLALLLAVRTLAVLPERRPLASTLRALLPLLGFLPVLAYQAWLLILSPHFRVFSAVGYGAPPLTHFALALAPAALLAALWWPARAREGEARGVQLHLFSWGALGVGLAVLRPVPYVLQFLVGIGVPLFALAALGMARRPPALTLALAALNASTAVVALAIVLRPNPRWMVPWERYGAALALGHLCRTGDRVFGPADVGLYANGLSACTAWISHGGAAGYAEREAEVERFYAPAPAAERAALLDRTCMTHVLLPGDAGPAPAAWLGPGTAFTRAAIVPGPYAAIGVYARPLPSGCAPGPP